MSRAVPAGSGKLELLHCPFPSAITHFPALGVVSSPPLQVNDFTGQQNLVRAVPCRDDRSHPIPMAFPGQEPPFGP